MSLLDCVGDIGIVLADAFFTLGVVLVFIFGPLAPLFWLWTKGLESSLGVKGRFILSAGLFLIAFVWVVLASTVLECMGY